jgi:hypothetical protein
MAGDHLEFPLARGRLQHLQLLPNLQRLGAGVPAVLREVGSPRAGVRAPAHPGQLALQLALHGRAPCRAAPQLFVAPDLRVPGLRLRELVLLVGPLFALPGPLLAPVRGAVPQR